ncbi:16S rRNA (guanine1516-N2)-methyltransferase [Moraxella cuniculi DSM 21768]|uniref:16S rRNA (Guanine1516-N2)-methyltransferase n=1 Tax=Moraxella cuniculi DSM 21768 TaxID=1122245 RepID=A0A1N7DBZ1_9GAMM|nr:class I SAM-dependent methyltransferase [Moraxella cuniculi]OOS07966.1 hypothetical protein B0189_01040 [Moraxella cuniculi]SIR73328.1 16S rRNA (guanine1516-N2)-methyltransferase [Moraxella cuniculi DSM 21768]
MLIPIITNEHCAAIDTLWQLNDKHALGLQLGVERVDNIKINDKILSRYYENYNTPFLAIIKNTPMLIKSADGEVVKSSLNWQSLTHRIVSAGRKSELLLQACKITQQMSVLDGTAGFGHDGLLLASAAARTTLCESHPVMALLLLYEYHLMLAVQNWQGLLGRIQIIHQDSTQLSGEYDCVYLDPMFPKDSYKAKVGKQMQLLHDLAKPPTADDEEVLFCRAMQQLSATGRLIVKRPIHAPYLAGRTPTQSVQNAAIRFDRYESSCC